MTAQASATLETSLKKAERMELGLGLIDIDDLANVVVLQQALRSLSV